ncbi:MAG: RNA polymerase sigma factor [Burkholderiales bacterium]
MNPALDFSGALFGEGASAGPDSPHPRTETAPAVSPAKLAEQALFVSLLARMEQGEEKALGELYDATIGRVYGFALRIISNPQAAEEIASDVYLQAWRDAGRYDGARAKVLTWLLMICRSRSLDWRRGRDLEVLHDSPETLVEEPPSDAALPDLLEATETHAALHAALQTFTPIQRQLVSLAFFRGMSHQEIADHAQLPLGTVKNHVRRALETLHTVLG